MDNVIIANFNGHLHAVTDPLWRYDEGMRLQFEGVDLPTAYQVHFANEKDGDAIPVYGDETGAEIPYELLEDGYNVYAWVYVTGDGYGRTKYVAQIPVMIKARPSEEEPSPVQQSALDEAINAVNEAAENLESATSNIPSEINAALTEAKESGEFDGKNGEDGSGVWYTTARISGDENPFISRRDLIGREGAAVKIHDLLLAPDVGCDGEPTTLYEITSVGTVCTLKRLCKMQGANGTDGASAYEIAVEHGFSGSETEWLESLQGEDGFAPEVTITEITGGHRITITSAAHPEGQSLDVMDGQGGSGTVDDYFSPTSENPVQNKVITNVLNYASQQLSAFRILVGDKVDKIPGKGLSTNDFTNTDKAKLDDAATEGWVQRQGYLTSADLADYRTASEQNLIDDAQDAAIAAKYSKPASGIPKSDMAEDVQTSLAKANTALQKHQSLTAYRTAQAQDTIDQQQNTAIAAKYTKPSSGIPASDLAEDAQRGYTSEERVTLVPEGTYTFSADAGDGAGYAYGLDFSSVPDMDFDSPPESVMIVVDGVEYEKQYNASESESSGYTAAIYGTTDIPTNDCALIIELNLLRQGITEEAITPIVRLNVIEGEEQHTLSAYFIRQPVTTTPDFDAAVAKSSAEALAEKLDTDGDAYRAASIPMGQLDSTSTATVMTAQVDGITELRDGVCVWLRNGVIASASGVTLDINGLGAKPIYNSLSGAIVTTTFATASTYLFVYNSTRVTGGCWDMVYGYDANTTYTPVKLGFGYATCSTAASTTAKTAALSSYTLTTGGIVAVKFTNAVPAGATLNINSKGAKAIYYKGAAITADVIKAGDTVTMIYSTYYHVLSIDRDVGTLPPSPSNNIPEAVSTSGSVGGAAAYARADHVHAISASTVESLLDEYVSPFVDMLVLPSGAADGSPVMLRANNMGNGFVRYELMSARKHITYFVIPLVAEPAAITDFQIVSDASVSKVYATANGLGLQYNGIADGKLYSAEVVLPFDSEQGTGTLSVTNLALPSAQGVSF